MRLEIPTRISASPAARRARTTPGLLVTITVALVGLGLVWSVAGLLAVGGRAALVDDVRVVSGPLSVHALDIYRSLSDADATAAAAFLGTGAETSALRTRYLDDVATAGSAIASALRATSSASDPGRASENQLRALSTGLPVYTGLVETARAYDRQQLPLGAAYLREASGLMRDTLLPAAQRLFTLETGRLADAQRSGADFPVLVLIVGLALLLALAGAQVFLTRRTNRLVNPGLAVASAATVVALVWFVVAVGSAVGNVNIGRETGSEQFIRLAEARVVVLQARADESLTLIARGDGAANERHYAEMLNGLIGNDGRTGLLGDAAAAPGADRDQVRRIAGLAARWRTLHADVRALDDSGRYAEAVRLAAGPPSATFEQLDRALDEYADAAGRWFDARADDAAADLAGARVAVLALGLIALAAVVLGTRNRIGEYR
ncbi:hypothetical protein [Cryptosporangium arvum]|uniref:hypothetical protein n=1 Tax=Cryptosporangium arvum TaxID=80871 RepID=UPI0004B4C1AE|nr:hypothetical protein [Cryptosporangium arvum]